MKNTRIKKTVRSLAERLKAIRRRPLSPADEADLNRVFDEIERGKPDSESERQKRKIAKSPGAEL